MNNFRKTLLLLVALVTLSPAVKADKGMWILRELNQENRERMRELGFNMPFEQLYNEDGPALYNAVVIFGGGCTGITVSNQGLLFTNHHCGYSAIQSQSTVEHDYLRDGFVSHSFEQELPIPGLSVQYLRDMVDVTERVMKAAEGIENELDRLKAIQKEISAIENEVEKEPNTSARVYPFYNNNVYYLVSYDVFQDVRMVFAPPTSIGKFGGDTDNWMWPRHTGDFSVFRVYADANNKPAKYSKDNKPYTPKAFAKISLQGVWDYDYAMTIGFPGSTDRYLSSWGVDNRMKNQNAPRIEVRGLKQDVWKKFMDQEQAIRIQYASKYAGSSNYWKNSIGMNKGLRQLNVVGDKQRQEREFSDWVNADPQRQQKYGAVLDSMRVSIMGLSSLDRNRTYLTEAFSGMEITTFANEPLAFEGADVDIIYKNYSPKVAAATVPVMLKVVKERVEDAYLPDIYNVIDEKFGGDYERYTNYLFENSVYATPDKLKKALADKDFAKNYTEDPAMKLRESFLSAIRNIGQTRQNYVYRLAKGNRLYFAGLKEKDPEKALPSDANFTMRMSYGKVSGYVPFDATFYDYYTTQKGIFEKYDPEVGEFNVQPEIMDLFRSKDFGRYADPSGNLRLCFLSDNDITGGNSGSPVFDGNGNLIGLAFDGNWEAMSGDIEFEPNLQRMISVDIRYVMWVIEKWGKSQYILDEVTFVE